MRSLLFLPLWCWAVSGQQFDKKMWETPVNGQVSFGNGVFLTPSEKSVIVTSRSGSVTSLNARTGKAEWTYTPPAEIGPSWECKSGVSFSADGTFFVYAISDLDLSTPETA